VKLTGQPVSLNFSADNRYALSGGAVAGRDFCDFVAHAQDRKDHLNAARFGPDPYLPPVGCRVNGRRWVRVGLTQGDVFQPVPVTSLPKVGELVIIFRPERGAPAALGTFSRFILQWSAEGTFA
jgi:hypothetical protein